MVRATAGRDKDGLYAVAGEQGGYVLICDGRRRPVERPKRKNPRHLEATEHILPEEGIITNRNLRRSLKLVAERMRPDC